MTTQNIFKNFGSNWKWASLDKNGKAWVHTYEPNVPHRRGTKDIQNVRAEAFDQGPLDERVSWARTDFNNGPAYETDKFGMALCPPSVMPAPAPAPEQQPAPLPPRGYCTNLDCWNEKAIGWNQCETHRPRLAPAPPMPMAPVPAAPTLCVQLTTGEAENGGLWAYARDVENYVSVNSFGVVWFNLFKDGPEPRRAYGVEVGGVTVSIERTRSVSECQPPEAGKPCPTLAPTHPGLREDGLEQQEADTPDSTYSVEQFATLGAKIQKVENRLNKAKARAKALLSIYVADGGGTRPALTELQYLAIFGELPN